MNRAVIETGAPQRFNILRAHLPRIASELVGKFDQRALDHVKRREIGGRVGEPLDEHACIIAIETCRFQYAAETRSVMVQSIVAVVQRRHANGNHFPLPPRQRPWPVHQLQIELVVLPHHGRMHAVNPQDVVVVRHPILGWELFVTQIRNEGHRLILGDGL